MKIKSFLKYYIMLDLQEIVVLSTAIITILSFILAILLSLKYFRTKVKNYIFWSSGLYLFSLGAFLELIFALGYYNEFLIDFYLFIVAILVNLLALGSIQFFSNKIKKIYYIYSIITDIILLISFFFVKIGNIIQNYVVFGVLPLLITITSSLVTFPAVIVLLISAIISIRKAKNIEDKEKRRHKIMQMSSIIAGVILLSIAGTLYIAAYPELLYWSQFFGVILLWLGFI
ncbi:hypothetical protein YN1_5220 [Nanoarchaeota archaeon]